MLGHISCGFEGNYFTSLEVIGEKGILHADMFNLIESEIELRRFTNRELETELITNGNCYVKEIDDFTFEDFEIVGYEHHPLIKMDVSV